MTTQRTLNTLTEINEIARGRNDVYVRWSRGPALDKSQGRSLDYTNHTAHAGLSCQRVYGDDHDLGHLLPGMLIEYSYLQRKDPKIYGWVFAARRNGTDSDNAPTVDAKSIVPIGRLSDALVKALREYNRQYWASMRAGFDWSTDKRKLPMPTLPEGAI